jgi:hypothetical protein
MLSVRAVYVLSSLQVATGPLCSAMTFDVPDMCHSVFEHCMPIQPDVGGEIFLATASRGYRGTKQFISMGSDLKVSPEMSRIVVRNR